MIKARKFGRASKARFWYRTEPPAVCGVRLSRKKRKINLKNDGYLNTRENLGFMFYYTEPEFDYIGDFSICWNHNIYSRLSR